jgi:phosphatidylglycerol---prolipoprotein diacylglyceryl transferase
MHPTLFSIGPFTIYSYGVMLAVAIVVCAALMSKDAAKEGIAREVVFDLMFWCVLWGILGARLFYIILNWSYFMTNPMEIPMLQQGGLAWQGGFIGGTIAGIAYVRRRKLPLRKMMDLTAPYIALGQAFGRVGCFFNGCCYGRHADWGIYFPVHDDRLQPTQLYETIMLTIIFFALKSLQKRPHAQGTIFALYFCFAAIERFIVEFFRADHASTWFGLSLFQYISLGIFTTGLILFKVMQRETPVHRR